MEEAAVEMLALSDEKDGPSRVAIDVKDVLCGGVVPCIGMPGS
jgi:hypothetical protein